MRRTRSQGEVCLCSTDESHNCALVRVGANRRNDYFESTVQYQTEFVG